MRNIYLELALCLGAVCVFACIIWGIATPIREANQRWAEECERIGGIPIDTRSSRALCVGKDSLLNVVVPSK